MTTKQAGAPLQLLEKLHTMMTALKGVPKNGYNKQHNYHYALERDVLEAVREQLIEHRVMIVPQTNAAHLFPLENKLTLTDLEMGYTITDLESGETLFCPWRGQGADYGGDKGLYKAFTGGNKYFSLMLFQIPRDDDPENDKFTDQPTNTPKNAYGDRSATNRANSSDSALTQKIDRLRALAKEKKIPPEAKSALKQLITSGEITIGVADDYLRQYELTPEKPPKKLKPKDDLPFNEKGELNVSE